VLTRVLQPPLLVLAHRGKAEGAPPVPPVHSYPPPAESPEAI
jgi:hypothetical protein